MTRVGCVLAVLPLLAVLGVTPSACSKFSDTSDAPLDAGAPEVVAVADAAVEHRLYVFGGMTALPAAVLPIKSAYVSVVSAETGDLGKWTKLPALEADRFAASWAQVGDTQLAAGGTANAVPYSKEGERGALPLDATDPAIAWRGIAPMGTGRDYAAAFSRGTGLYVSGGKNAAGTVGSIERYDTTVDSWATVGSLDTGVAGHAMLVHDSRVYVLGGDRLGSSGVSSAVFMAPLAGDGHVGTFSRAGDLKAAVAYHSVVLVEPWLFSIGGATATETVPSVQRGTFDGSGSGALMWDTLTSLPVANAQKGIAEACAVVIGRTIYVMGGRDVATDSSKAEVYIGRVDDHGAVTWSTGPLLPEGRSALGCAVSPSSAP
jgi:hypothetical protein